MIGIGEKVALTGLVVSIAMALIPPMANDPPAWVKATVIVTFFAGLLAAIFGALWAIWV